MKEKERRSDCYEHEHCGIALSKSFSNAKSLILELARQKEGLSYKSR